jgi:dTDP-4-dehydrorhamnose reductase
MKILIIGLSGMMGHKLFTYLQNQNCYDLYSTTTTNFKIEYPNFKIVNKKNIFYTQNQDINFFDKIFSNVNPDIVINCSAILKESFFNQNPTRYIEVNSVYPHKISVLSEKYNFRFIHFSTDIVYSDKNKLSSENDKININSIYATTKLLGEVTYNNSLTIRTSIIGHQLNSNSGLVEWFLNNGNKSINGFSNVIYSGLTTTEMSKIFHNYIIPNNNLSGIINISSNPISKFDLLKIIKKYYKIKTEIIDDKSIVSNRSLNFNLFKQKTEYLPPSWDLMIKEMHNDYLDQKMKSI